MPVITLPDGAKRSFDTPVSVFQVAENISPGLARVALAGKVDGRMVDLDYLLEKDAEVQIITGKVSEGLEVIRHSTAHLLAQAVKQLYPQAQVTIGPVIESGFYYDFAIDHPFTPEDLIKIETRMAELASQNIPVSHQALTRAEAIEYFKSIGELYKVEIIEGIPEGETLTLYTQGDFTDLCRGPHVPHTGHTKVFKLLSVAGSYWRGDAKNAMLQRIYGTAFADKKDLQAHLHRLEEAEKRDHRKIGKALDLFHLQEEAPGQVFWHEKGYAIWRVMESHIREIQKSCGFLEVKTPLIADIHLWEQSGHQAKYSQNMFMTSSENRLYALKPMNCPCHVQIFKQGLKSYRDLPLRLSEFGACHRNEFSGALHGIMRVRGFTQDDGHIFCTENQIQAEVATFMNATFQLYQDFGFEKIIVRLATRPKERIGEDAVWDRAEAALAEALTQVGVQYELLPGEGAFYGPKVELHLEDCIGRTWQCGTIQLDFMMPGRLGAYYIDEDNQKKAPVMLHRAAIGTFERFIGILIEHYAGTFPVWLAPVQVVVMGISEKHEHYVVEIERQLNQYGYRAKSDLRNEKIAYKIRAHSVDRVPYQVIVGDNELNNKTISVRTLQGQDLGSMPLDRFRMILDEAIARKGRMADPSSVVEITGDKD
ncbi:MAG: threonine--tRNA ligase [Gammaproteobacteria bacterium]|nr:threonine--tRNA ligase [Gammaproteobacteria bacterium]